MKKAAIIIVNWNGLKFLKNCLSSVYKQTYKNFDVYFVDNGSVDGSSDFVRKNFPKTKIVQLDKNYGFTKGNNEGIKEAFKDKSIEYIVCLNNDTLVNKNWLKELILSSKNKSVGLVQSKVFLGDGKTLHSVGGIIYPDYSSESIGFGEKDTGSYEDQKYIESALGCSILVKRKVLEKVGLFDEKFFSYKEDDDLSLRIKIAGYNLIYSPKSYLTHFHSSTLGAQSPKKVFYNERNRLFNLIVYGSPIKLLSTFPFTIKRFIGNKKSLKKDNKKIQLMYAIAKAYLSLFIYTPYLIKKRIHIKKWLIKNYS